MGGVVLTSLRVYENGESEHASRSKLYEQYRYKCDTKKR